MESKCISFGVSGGDNLPEESRFSGKRFPVRNKCAHMKSRTEQLASKTKGLQAGVHAAKLRDLCATKMSTPLDTIVVDWPPASNNWSISQWLRNSPPKRQTNTLTHYINLPETFSNRTRRRIARAPRSSTGPGIRQWVRARKVRFQRR